MKVKWWQFAAGGLLILGMGFTVWDWRNWREEETGKFGHGYEEQLAPAAELDKLYQNEIAGVRVKYPRDWTVSENSKFKILNTNQIQILENMVNLGERAVVAEWPGFMKLSVERVERGLPDLADAEVRKLARAGHGLSKEREYLGAQETGVTLLTWETLDENREVVVAQRAMAVEKGTLVVMDVEMLRTEWLNWARTFEAVWKSLVYVN